MSKLVCLAIICFSLTFATESKVQTVDLPYDTSGQKEITLEDGDRILIKVEQPNDFIGFS